MKHSKKRTPSLQWNMKEVLLCSWAALCLCAWQQVWWNLKTLKDFKREISCPLPEILVSITSRGSCQDNDPKLAAQNTQEWLSANDWNILKCLRMSPDLNCIEHPWKELKHATWRKQPETTRVGQYQLRGAQVSVRITKIIWFDQLTLGERWGYTLESSPVNHNLAGHQHEQPVALTFTPTQVFS